jgi:hypothetical protein
MRTGTQLESFSGLDWSNGVQIDELRELDTLSVQTRNSTYEIVVTSPRTGQVLVRGGAHFQAFTPARLSGSSVGGCVLKQGGVYPGFRLELECGGRRILTSTVESVERNPPYTEQ